MQFLYPTFLYALPLALIPIIIHLFNFRRYKTVYYSNVQFLKQVKEQNKSVRKIKNILVLLFRILAIISLVIIFAGPYIPPEKGKYTGNNSVIIYVDNSFSTQAEGQNGRLFETIKSKAQEVVDTYNDENLFLFLNNDLNPKHLHFVSKKQIKEFISESKLSGYTLKMSEIIKKTKQLAKDQNPNGKADLYLISDFQKSITDVEKFIADSMLNIALIPIKPEITQNIFIDSIGYETPYRALNKHEKLNVKIVNKSDQDYLSIPIRLYLNDSLRVPAVFDIKANGETIVPLEYTNTQSGNIKGRIEIDDYPITFDNNLYFALKINENRKVLTISDKDNLKYIKSVVADDNYFLVDEQKTNKLQLSKLPNYDVVVLNSPDKIVSGLNQQVANFVSEGGTLVLFAGKNADQNSYNEFLQKLNLPQIMGVDTAKVQIKYFDKKAHIYQNAFDKKQKNPQLPILKNTLILNSDLQNASEILLKDERNRTVLVKKIYGKGQIYFFNFAGDETSGNFVFHPLWIPTIYNIFLLERYAEDYYFKQGEAFNIAIQNADYESDKSVHLKSSKNDADYILERTGDRIRKSYAMPPVMTQAGNYRVTQGDKFLQNVAVNYKRTESVLEPYSADELAEEMKKLNLNNYNIIDANSINIEQAIKENRTGTDLTYIFIILSLLFILGEILSIRVLNRNRKADN